ncbi:MAG: hypothetical protein K5928_08050 [Prevotella sp.]|nr:hypothetical protein [Prevotella sp.]
MIDFWLGLLYLLVTLTLVSAVGSWLRSLVLRDPDSYSHHGVPARGIAVGVTVLLVLVLAVCSTGGLVSMLINTIAILLVVAAIAAITGGSGVLRKLRK